MMLRQIITGDKPNATPDHLLALVETARTNALTAQRLVEEIESLEEITMSDLADIARRCGATLKALGTLKANITGDDEPPQPTPAAARRPAHLSVVEARAA